VKQAWDEIVSKAGLYGQNAMAPASEKAAAWSFREASNSFRQLLNTNPTIEALNSEASFWIGLRNVLNATKLRKVGQTGGLIKAGGAATGAAVGGMTGDSYSERGMNAIFGGLAGQQFVRLVQSPYFMTKVSAPMKQTCWRMRWRHRAAGGWRTRSVASSRVCRRKSAQSSRPNSTAMRMPWMTPKTGARWYHSMTHMIAPPTIRYALTATYSHCRGLGHVFARASHRASHGIGAHLSKVAAILIVLGAQNPLLWAQTGGVLPVPRQTFLDTSGNPVAAGTLYHYSCGTTTDLNVYSDSSLSTALPQPISLNSAGRPQTSGLVETAVYLAAVCHKFVLKDSTGSTLWTQDNVYPQNYLGSGTFGNTYFLRGDATSGYVWSRPVTVITTTSTGNQDDFAPGLIGDTVIRCNNASLLTIRGFASGYDGQRIYLVSMGAGEVDLAHQNANSSAANRLINYVTSGVTPLAAGVGTAQYVYDGTTARWRLVQHEQGDWITPTFAAGNYTGSGSMTWTVAAGDRTLERFYVRGRQLTYETYLNTTTVAVVSTDLRITLPNSYTVPSQGGSGAIVAAELYKDNGGTATLGRVYVSRSILNAFEITKIDLSNWTAATDTTEIAFAATVQLL
jgi:hypothetical protein